MKLVGAWSPGCGFVDFQPIRCDGHTVITVEMPDGSKLPGPFPRQTCRECLRPLSGEIIAVYGDQCVHKGCLAGVIGLAELKAEGLA